MEKKKKVKNCDHSRGPLSNEGILTLRCERFKTEDLASTDGLGAGVLLVSATGVTSAVALSAL